MKFPDFYICATHTYMNRTWLAARGGAHTRAVCGGGGTGDPCLGWGEVEARSEEDQRSPSGLLGRALCLVPRVPRGPELAGWNIGGGTPAAQGAPSPGTVQQNVCFGLSEARRGATPAQPEPRVSVKTGRQLEGLRPHALSRTRRGCSRSQAAALCSFSPSALAPRTRTHQALGSV